VSIVDFQRALCDLTLNPVMAASVLRNAASSLAGYQLTEVEQRRIVAVVRQPGMSVNCTLARANRFAPVADAFPLTCSLLKPVLRPLLDELWNIYRPGTYQLAGEADAFREFLQQKLSHGELNGPYVEEIVHYECAAWELIQTLRRSTLDSKEDPGVERSVVVRFSHDPRILVRCLERDEIPPPDLPAGDYVIRLILRGTSLDVVTEA
jgi:hypothetical protein